MNLTLTVILAIAFDHWLGEPEHYHPLAGFGKLASMLEKKMRHPAAAIRQRTAGLLAWMILVLPLPLLLWWLPQQPWIDFFLNSLILYACIAANSLKQHARHVYQHLINNETAKARSAVSYLVSRQTQTLDTIKIRRATIESVLENGSDAVFAPLFWFIIGGPAAVVLYRLSNTLDAMWGYKTPDFIHFGWASARFDDLLNWIPSRLTALSYTLLGNPCSALRCWYDQAHLLDSPNAGPVMTAGAGALNIQLGGAGFYHGRLKSKILFGTTTPVRNNDIPRANVLITKTMILWVICISVGDYFA